MAKLSSLFQDAGLTGKLKHNSPLINAKAIQECLDGTSYWTFGIKALDFLGYDLPKATEVVASSLGLSLREFQHGKHAMINPDTTMRALGAALSYLRWASENHKTVLFATGHPGSMLGAYQLLADQTARWGGRVYRLPDNPSIEPGLWLDSVGDCIVTSDEGTLHHTHDGRVLEDILQHHRIDLVVADHGFAGAAINAGKTVIAIFDTDDPAIPLMASAQKDGIIAVPLNDNQKNLTTAAAFAALLKP